MQVKTRGIIGLIGACAIITLAATFAQALEEFRTSETQSFEIGASPNVTIETISGDVTYTGGDGTSAAVEIVTEVRARDAAEAADIRKNLKLVLDGTDGFLDVRVENPRQFYEWLRDEYTRSHHVSVSFHVRGPRGAEGMLSSVSGHAGVDGVRGPVQIESVSGDVSAVGIERRVRASSTSGSVDVRRVKDAVFAEAVSGDVGVTGCGGHLEAAAVSGSIRVREAGGRVRAETVSGEIELIGVALDVTAESVSGSISVENEAGDVRASSTSGSIDIHTKTSGDIDIGTVSGSVDLAVVPGDLGDAVLESISGTIDVSLPLDVTRKTKRRLEGRLGTGSAIVRVSTSSGGIALGRL